MPMHPIEATARAVYWLHCREKVPVREIARLVKEPSARIPRLATLGRIMIEIDKSVAKGKLS